MTTSAVAGFGQSRPERVAQVVPVQILDLGLPTGRIETHAAPVRYELLDEPEKGHLIGVRIKWMSAGDRARLVQNT